MKKAVIATVLGLFMAQEINASVLYLYGKVDSVNTANPLIKVNDSVTFAISYNSNNVITLSDVYVDRSDLHMRRMAASPPSYVFIDSDPSDGSVQWMVSDSLFHVDVATNTPGGVIPCIEDFDKGNSFSISFNCISASGTLLAVPRTRAGN
jgi:hypothetical protein